MEGKDMKKKRMQLTRVRRRKQINLNEKKICCVTGHLLPKREKPFHTPSVNRKSVSPSHFGFVVFLL
jgi:hypothetical protein